MSKPVTAATVREFFNSKPERLATLSDAARHTVEQVEGKSPRGRLHPEVVKAFNTRRRSDRRYVSGAGSVAAAKAKAEAEALRAAAKAAGVEVGARGPLSKAAKAVLATPKA